MSEPALKEVPSLPLPLGQESEQTAAEKFKAAKEAKRAAKRAKREAKVEAEKPSDKLKEEDRVMWLLQIECVKRCEAEVTVARLAFEKASRELEDARKNHQTETARIYAANKMNVLTDRADLNTGEIKRGPKQAENGKP